MLKVDSRARVDNLDRLGSLLSRGCPNADLRPRRAVLDRIVNNVDESFTEQHRIDPRDCGRISIDDDRLISVLGEHDQM